MQHATRAVHALPAWGFALALALVLAVVGAGPVQAAPAAPSGLTPSGDSVKGAPVLTWDRVAGATSYNVQVATTSDFASVKYKASTSNRRVTPNVQLPFGEVWWRVQAVSSSGTSDWVTTSFDRPALAGPTLISPESDVTLDQPEQPVLLSWTPVPGATSYTIEIDDADDFIGATTYSTKTSSYVVPSPQIARPYFWRVRATLASGIVSEYSETRTYKIGGLDKPVLTSPTDSALTSVEDVVLDWEPVMGAASYDLQISTDENFNTIEHARTTVATRYSPPTTLDNDQYYWRVRPIDTLGNVLDWSFVDTWEFRRHWPDQPTLEYPADNAVVGDPFFYQWTPVDKASSYTVQISTSSTFQTVTSSCNTVNTTYVPTGGDCWPGAANTYYWRVIAHDDPEGVDTDAISAQVGRFSYLPSMVDLDTASPADGSTVQVPTLTWDPVPGAAQYKVFITAVDGGSNSVNGATTSATTYTPRNLLTVGKTYRWWVQTVSANGRAGASLVPAAQHTFTVSAQDPAAAATPELTAPLDGAEVVRMPTMTWDAVAGADYYTIGFRPTGTVQAFTYLADKFAYPAGEDATTAHLSPDDYEWTVTAWDSTGTDTAIATSQASRVLTVTDNTAASGPRVAMSGTATGDDATSCTATLPTRCEDMRQTPVLRWDPVPNAGGYRIWLSHDKEMTNLFASYPRTTDSTMWTPTTALIDSQAGDAFYWVVEPCTVSGRCRPLEHAAWAFNKKSNQVELTWPADGATVSDDVTLRWNDYLSTNADGVEAHSDSTGVSPRQEAQRYRVEVSTVPNFQSILDSATVDQTTYTAPSMTYPEGILYWRVSVIDGSGNVVGTSAPQTMTKSSPVPELASPKGGDAVSRTEPFRWKPLAFAASYDVEVYKNGDILGQTGNRVVSGNSKQVAFTTTSPIPASDQPYTWRIRRVDASGRKGAWSDLADEKARFLVVGTAPTLTGPSDGAVVAGNDALFTWQGVEGAGSYRFERRASGATSISETVTTPGLAWAPTKTVADGVWQWRVTTLDAAGAVMMASSWRTFTVDSTAPTVTSHSPTGKVKRDAVFVAKFSEPVVNVSTTTMRIYLKGVPDPVPAAVSINAAGTKATLDPSRNLKAGKTYTIKLTNGITDRAGNPLVATRWKVTT